MLQASLRGDAEGRAAMQGCVADALVAMPPDDPEAAFRCVRTCGCGLPHALWGSEFCRGCIKSSSFLASRSEAPLQGIRVRTTSSRA